MNWRFLVVFAVACYIFADRLALMNVDSDTLTIRENGHGYEAIDVARMESMLAANTPGSPVKLLIAEENMSEENRLKVARFFGRE